MRFGYKVRFEFKYRAVFALSLALSCWLAFTPAVTAQDKAASDKPATTGTVYPAPLYRAWQAILDEAGIDYKTTIVMQGRRQRMFIDGLLTLDCCFNPSWRNQPEEQEIQLFTDSFYTMEVRYVFKKGQVVPVPSPEHLKNMRFAAVRGFTYNHQEYFGEVIDAQYPGDAMRLVELGRAQLTEISTAQFKFEMLKKPRNLELGDLSAKTAMHARVHRSRAELLPRLNAAIARLKKTGRIKEIIETTVPE